MSRTKNDLLEEELLETRARNKTLRERNDELFHLYLAHCRTITQAGKANQRKKRALKRGRELQNKLIALLEENQIDWRHELGLPVPPINGG